MVAESLRMKGELEFTRLLRVDGRFEGELITDKGSLVVGPKGEVVGDLKNMQVSSKALGFLNSRYNSARFSSTLVDIISVCSIAWVADVGLKSNFGL